MSQPYRQDLNWLVTEFTTRVEDVAHAIVVSADGVPLALSAGIPEAALDQLAAITSGLTSLMQGAARVLDGGSATQALVEMDDGLLFVKAVSDGSSLAVLTAPECDTRQVSYEMTRLVGAVGELLTPAARAEWLLCERDDRHCGIAVAADSSHEGDTRLNCQAERSVAWANDSQPRRDRRSRGEDSSVEVKSRRRIRRLRDWSRNARPCTWW